MSARTIQHPGIEIREIDMTEYQNTVTTNNAYVMGFTDRGPIYNYSWITSRSEFINLYGTPQTEAEKYLYYAVMSILNNGGSPIVSRLPYDNKQCKAYKALKIKYASVIHDINAEYEFSVNNWENDTVFNNINSNPLIDLKSVGKYINPQGFDSVYETLQNQHVQIVSDSGQISEILTTDELESIKYTELLYNLSDTLRLRDKINDTDEAENYDNVSTNIQSLLNYAKIEYHDKAISVFKGLSSYGDFNTNLNDFISEITEEVPEASTVIKYLDLTKVNKNINSKLYEYLYACFCDIFTLNIFKNKFDALLSDEVLKINTQIKQFNAQSGKPISEFYPLVTLDPKKVEAITFTLETIKNYAGVIKDFITQSATDYPEELAKLFETKINLLGENGILYNITLSDTIVFTNNTDNTIKFVYTLLNIISTDFSELVGTSIGKIISDNDFSVEPQANLIKATLESFELNNLPCTFDNIVNVYNECGIKTIIVYPKKNDLLLKVFENYNIIDYLNLQQSILDDYYLKFVEYISKHGSNIDNSLDKQIKTLELLKEYVAANSSKHDKSVSGICDILGDKTIFNNEYDTDIRLTSKKYTQPVSGENRLSGMTLPEILTTYGAAVDVTTSANCPSVLKTDIDNLQFNIIYNNINPSGVISGWFDIFIRDIKQKKIENRMSSDTSVGRKLLINGENPADLMIDSIAIEPYLSDGDFSSILKDAPTISIDDAEKTPALKALDIALANIYNDPYFKKIDNNESEKQQAVVDAHLLLEPALSYKYGVYLDSAECIISNEQYDDLVTANNFTKADSSVSKYGEDIDTANFIIIDKNKSIVNGTGSNEGCFISIIDPYDALKIQRLLVNPNDTIPAINIDPLSADLASYGLRSKYNWKALFKNEINTLNTLQHVTNADGILIGEINDDKQLLDSWSTPLAANYYDESISKSLMSLFPQIPLSDKNSNTVNSICNIDKMYSSHIIIAVCKTVINPADGKITVSIKEQFFGSLFDEKSATTGASLYIGDVINVNSNYIEFYRNNYIKPAFGAGYDPAPYNNTAIPQFYIANSQELNNVCQMVGINVSSFDVDNKYTDAEGKLIANRPANIIRSYTEYLDELKQNNIFIFNKKNTILYNNHPTSVLTSFSKKESQKIIANTTGLFDQSSRYNVKYCRKFYNRYGSLYKFH